MTRTTRIDIGRLRRELKWTQARMAAYLGIDQSGVSRMESGATPSGPVLKLLGILQANKDLHIDTTR